MDYSSGSYRMSKFVSPNHCRVENIPNRVLLMSSLNGVVRTIAGEVGDKCLTCGNEKGGSRSNNTLVAPVHFLSKEHLALVRRRAPLLVQCKVGWGWLDQVKNLFSL